MEGVIAGRIVYFVKPNGSILPAIIIRVNFNETVDLKVFDDKESRDAFSVGIPWAYSVEYSEDAKANTWHWMPS